jgi:hypothetical protein
MSRNAPAKLAANRENALQSTAPDNQGVHLSAASRLQVTPGVESVGKGAL